MVATPIYAEYAGHEPNEIDMDEFWLERYYCNSCYNNFGKQGDYCPHCGTRC